VGSLELGNVVILEALWERLGMGKSLRRIQQEAGCQIPEELWFTILLKTEIVPKMTVATSLAQSSK
jgi:hypothetical protein